MIFSIAAPQEAEQEMLHAIRRALGNDRHVLWLVSGGSCITTEVAILQALSNDEVRRLTVMLADERYGTPGHDESNHAKLLAAGFSRSGFDFPNILTAGSIENVLAEYDTLLHRKLDEADSIVATLGIGADGHTAGILPDSIAAYAEGRFAVSYQAPDFIRITASFAALRRIDTAIIFAYGKTKQDALKRLIARRESPTSLPAAVLYDIPFVTIYNDCIKREGVS